MSKQRVAEVLAAHADGLIGQADNLVARSELSDQEWNQATPLMQIAEQLQQAMRPVQPSAAFVRSLEKELVGDVRRKVAVTKHVKRSLLIGAAALGSVVSVASVVGAIFYLVPRMRARAQARMAHLPTG